MYTLRQAARALGIDYKTLNSWLQRAGITDEALERDSLDSRIRYIPDDVLAGLAAEHGRTVSDPKANIDPAILARLDRLERRLASIENWRTTVSGYIDAPGSGSGSSYQPGYQPGDVLALPPEGASLRTFASRHGISPNTARNHELTGRIQTVQVPVPNRNEISHTLTDTQQAAAIHFWRATMPTYHDCDMPGCPCHASEDAGGTSGNDVS